jgi:hypothetical protein
MKISARPKRVLDIDVECRPLHWYGGDFVSKEITGIAWAWVSKRPRVEAVLLDIMDDGPGRLLDEFLPVLAEADIVTGHFIRGFDLPLIQGACFENERPLLGPTWTQDTKLDLLTFQGLSKSQENLGALLGLRHPKVGMNQRTWREANRLTEEGLRLTQERVVGDVRQHIEMRQQMLELGVLGPPKLWVPGGAPEEAYVA